MAVLVKTLNGLAYASVKTRNGLAVASIKTINGLDTTSGGGFLPSDVAGLQAWYKADALVLSDNDPVGTWTDSSGNGNDSTQATGSKKPIYKTGIINSLPAVLFDGSDDITKASFTLAVPWTFFYVVKIVSAPSGNGVFGDGSTADTMEPYCFAGGTELHVYEGSDFDSNTNLGTSVFHYISAVTNSDGSGQVWLDGSSVGTVGSGWGAVAAGGMSLGNNAGGAAGCNCYIAEAYVYNAALNTTDRQSNETYLATKYGL